MSCGTPITGGYRQPQAANVTRGARPGYSLDGMRICHACGAIAPTDRQACSICSQPFSRLEERAPNRPDGAYWAMLRTELTCRQCGSKSPIDEPEVDGTVTCQRCETIQALDLGVWRDGFAHAHAVADLSGPGLEGRVSSGGAIEGRNPYLPIGITNTTSTLELTGMSMSGGVMRTRNLSISASPGHPLCGVCHTPIEAELQGATQVATRCPTCGDRASYEMPASLPSLHAGLVLSIADDHRTDRPDARIQSTSAGMVVALHCPSCGGAIDVQVGEHAATCQFCKASCRIPSRTLLSLKKQNELPRPWWVLFRGPSPKRRELQRAQIEPQDVKQFLGGHGLEDPPVDRSQRSKNLDLAFSVVVGLAMLVAVSVVFFAPVIWGWVHGQGSDVPTPPLPWQHP
jgi:hypothetical protein